MGEHQYCLLLGQIACALPSAVALEMPASTGSVLSRGSQLDEAWTDSSDGTVNATPSPLAHLFFKGNVKELEQKGGFCWES